MSEAVPVLEMMAISKRFPGVQALSAVDFRLFSGEVHSVMGQTGAGKSILILDEPTSSLAEDEVKMLFSVVRRLKAQGMAILFITHFIDQTFEISDRITVLRNGSLVGEYPVSALSRMELITRMVGREIEEGGPARARDAGLPAAVAGGGRSAGNGARTATPFLSASGLGRRGSVRGVDLQVTCGESLGIGGLLGSGRTEIARLLFGIDRAEEGTILVEGRPAEIASPVEAILRGIGFCPEDRKLEGVIGELSLRENIILALQTKRGVFRNLSRTRQEEIAASSIKALGIKAGDAEMPIAQLSGGNQQKALLARWMATDPHMLILDEPTRGIDVAAKVEIMRRVMELCDKSMAVIFISAEMDEVVRYSNRVAVMRDRRKVGEIESRDADEHAVFQIIAGGQT